MFKIIVNLTLIASLLAGCATCQRHPAVCATALTVGGAALVITTMSIAAHSHQDRPLTDNGHTRPIDCADVGCYQ